MPVSTSEDWLFEMASPGCTPLPDEPRLSEHAVGNAIDFGGFVPRRGATVSVGRDYRPLEDSPSARGRFLPIPLSRN